ASRTSRRLRRSPTHIFSLKSVSSEGGRKPPCAGSTMPDASKKLDECSAAQQLPRACGLQRARCLPIGIRVRGQEPVRVGAFVPRGRKANRRRKAKAK